MKKEIDENIANALRTIKSACNSKIDNNCEKCPFRINTIDKSFCYFINILPCCWNIQEEKKYTLEYKEYGEDAE